MRPNLADILKAVLNQECMPYSVWESMSSYRVANIVRVKQMTSFIAHKYGYKHIEIAHFLKMHRTTVIYYIKTIEDLCSVYEAERDSVNKICEYLASDQAIQFSDISSAWLARSVTGLLTISPHKPNEFGGYWMAEGSKVYSPQESFPQVTYGSGPVKVKIKVTIDNDEKM